MKVGLIGYGYWGPNLVRNFRLTPNCEVKMVSDQDVQRLKLCNRSYPEISTTTIADEVLEETSLDAIIIATPVRTHYPLAKKALLNNKHVLVEKPLSNSCHEAKDLMALSAERGLKLMVDHTFLYSPAVRTIKQQFDSGKLGKLQYFDSTRINLGLFQSDVNVLWDLAPHDISILKFLHPETPAAVQAIGSSHTPIGESIAYLTLLYDSGFIAHFHCSWISPVKVRRILLGGDQKMVVYDDVEPTEKVKIYDSGFEFQDNPGVKHSLLVQYRAGDIFIPRIANEEPLQQMAQNFVNAVVNDEPIVSDANVGLFVISILEAAEKSLRSGHIKVRPEC